MPRADDIPAIAIKSKPVPTKTNPLGVKGAGEAGTVGALPTAVANALVDALSEFGVRHIEMPATAEVIWRAIRGGKVVSGCDPNQPCPRGRRLARCSAQGEEIVQALDHPKRDAVFAAVKAWHGEGRAGGRCTATASLDGVCARRHRTRASRDEETALRSNKETDQ